MSPQYLDDLKITIWIVLMLASPAWMIAAVYGLAWMLGLY